MKKNKSVLRLVNAFLGKDLKFKKGGRGIQKRYKFPRCKLFIDFFSSYIIYKESVSNIYI